MTVFVQAPSGSLRYTFDWSDEIPGGVTLDSVAHTVPANLTLVNETVDAVAKTSTIQLTGANHGELYLINALATLSNGEVIPAEATLRVFNG